MVRKLFVLLLITGASAQQPTFRGAPFDPGSAMIRFEAATNYPSKVWVYKVVPGTIQPNILSKLLFITKLGGGDKRDRIVGQAPFKDNTVLHYRSKDSLRHLTAVPKWGWLEFADKAVLPECGKPTLSVPSEEVALNHAKEFMDLLGLPSAELSKKPGKDQQLFYYQTIGKRKLFNKEREQTLAEEVYSRTLSFPRALDGIRFTGLGASGGFVVSFGNKSGVSSIELNWKKVEQHKAINTPAPSKLIELIKQAKATATSEIEGRNPPQEVVVKDVVFFYMGTDGPEPADYIIPFADLLVQVIFEDKSSQEIRLNCPLTSKE